MPEPTPSLPTLDEIMRMHRAVYERAMQAADDDTDLTPIADLLRVALDAAGRLMRMLPPEQTWEPSLASGGGAPWLERATEGSGPPGHPLQP